MGESAYEEISRRAEGSNVNATTLLALPIERFSCKVRTGPPDEPKADIDDPVWAGVIPLSLEAGPPVDAPDLSPDYRCPDRFRNL